ncbi:MAG: response regulator transcription factor [Armatimonadetes bacterium]|nr:response regulator transcription factor [Armatimonadota bacterium]
MSHPTILCIEDEEAACQQVRGALGKEGFELRFAASGAEGVEEARRLRPDLILLDLVLPEVGGLEVCRRIRGEMNVPIIMLTVKGEEVDRVVGLEIGADDYIAKPYSPRELVARVRAMLRRSALIKEAAERQKTLSFPGLEIDLPTRTVKADGESVHLTPKEFDLLYHLASQPRHVFSREQILEQVWGYQTRGGDLRTVDTHIKRLRKKLQEGRGDHPWSMATVWGVGYKFDVAP